MSNLPFSKMRKKWVIHYYKPKEICFLVLARASKYKTLVWPECRPFIEKLCNKYSFDYRRTMWSIIPESFVSETLYIESGHIANRSEVFRRLEGRRSLKLIGCIQSFSGQYSLVSQCRCCLRYVSDQEMYINSKVIRLRDGIKDFGNCKKCRRKENRLYEKESEIKQINSLINKVKKECQKLSRQQAT